MAGDFETHTIEAFGCREARARAEDAWFCSASAAPPVDRRPGRPKSAVGVAHPFDPTEKQQSYVARWIAGLNSSYDVAP